MILVSNFIWWIYGLVISKSHYIKVCSGVYYQKTGGLDGDAPYQWKSGKFIEMYYRYAVWDIGVSICLFVCMCVCLFG